MSNSWYQAYFTEDYWRFTESRYSAEQTANEIEYLLKILEEAAPGRRVVDLGCGVGRHAIGLAQASFEVIGLDISEWAIDRAKQRSARAGIEVRWEIVNLLGEDRWPLAEIDAAICLDTFGWGSDAAQRRLLRRLRGHLVPNGILILSHSNLPWVVHNFVDADSRTVGEVRYSFQQTYNPASGRSQGSLTASIPGKMERVLPYDMRLYSIPELISLIREAGFVIDRLEADFKTHNPPGLTSRCIQVCAQPLSGPPAALAVASWRTPPEERLDLRYAPDEAEWLEPSPNAIWEELLNGESHQGAEAAGYYPVNDPYGGERAAAVVSQHFGFAIAPDQLTLGPGVTSLLHDLCDLADGGLILGPQLVHPDVTAWGAARGHEIHFVEEPATLDRFITEIRARRPSLVHLDRPKLFAGELISLDDLYRLGMEAARVGATVLVDESPATYLGPAGSAVPLIQRLDNLVILRGLTKAYSWGGLRVGFAYASKRIGARVRELVCPLQVGELAFRAAMRLLAAGDIFHRLRVQIRTVKPETIGLLRSIGLEVIEGHPDLPWVNVADAGGETSRRLDCLGIRGLRFVPSPAVRGPFPERVLLFSPLSDERMAQLRRHLEGAVEGMKTTLPASPRSATTQNNRPIRPVQAYRP